MNSLIETLNRWGGRIPDFAWPMLWQSSVLIAVLFVFDFVARRKVRASIRYALWLVVLVKLLLPPTLALPTSLAWWVRPLAPQPKAQARTTAFVVTYGDFVPANLPTPAPPVFVPPPKPYLSGAGQAAATWVVVGAGLLVWLVVRWRQVAGNVRQAAVAPALLNEVLDEPQQGIKLPRRVRLLVTNRAMSPAVCGLFRPVILLPQSLVERLTPSQLRAVLLHELVHLRRGDVWVNCAQALLQIFYWWHPLLWLANARIRRVREEAVDDAVMLALRDDAETYAPTLVEVAKLAFNRPLASLGLVGIMESRSALRQRIERLMDFRPPRAAGVSLVSTLCTITFAAFALPMGERSINSVASTADELATQTDKDSNPVATTNFTGPFELSGTKPDSVVQHNHTTGMATVSNGARVSYNGIILTADSVSVDLQSRIVEADGHVWIARGSNPIGNWVAEHLRLTSEGETVIVEGSGFTVGGVANTSVRNFRMNLYAPLSNETTSATQVSAQKQTESASPPPVEHSNTNEEVKLRMIVLNKPVAGDAAQIRKLAEDIIAKVKGGVAFSKMASVYSEGRQGREGGDWGWVQKYDRDGALVLRKELADVAFSLKPGELSGIIETPEAIYLMLVEDKRPARIGEARYNEAERRRAQDSGTRVNQARMKDSLSVPNPYITTNLIFTGRGRQAILTKLDRIRIDTVRYQDMGLSEVVNNLREEAKNRDPESIGINFLVDPNPVPFQAKQQVAPATGLPVAAAESDGDIAAIPISIDPPLTNVRLADVLEAIVRAAGNRIKYSIEDYAVVFSGKGTELEPLLVTRTLVFDPEVFLPNLLQRMHLPEKSTDEEAIGALPRYLADAGLDLQPPCSCFLKERGLTLFHAPQEKIEAIERLFTELNNGRAQSEIPAPWRPPDRETIIQKLDQIRIDSPAYNETPLIEVIRDLSWETKHQDLERKGLSFHVKYSAKLGKMVDLGAVKVTVPAISNARLSDLLDAILKGADKPIKYFIGAGVGFYSTEDEPGFPVGMTLEKALPPINPRQPTDAIDPSLARTKGQVPVSGDIAAPATSGPFGNTPPKSLYESTPVHDAASLVKIFKFRGGGSYWAGGKRMNLEELRAWLAKTKQSGSDTSIGFEVNSNAPPKAVRALTELGAEFGMQTIPVIHTAPQINIKAKFIQMPEQAAETLWLDWMLTNSVVTTDAVVRMSPVQRARMVQHLKAQEGVDILSSPEVTTLSGRQAQVQVVDFRTIVIAGVNPQALAPPGVTSTNVFRPEQTPFGTTFDVVPVQSAYSAAIHLTITATVTEFLGYDEPNWTNGVVVYVDGKKTTVNPAMPHIRTRNITTDARVNDGQTLVIRGSTTEDVVRVKDKVPILGDLPLAGRLFRSESTTKQRKTLIILVTPTLVDSAGNRIHGDDELAPGPK